MSLPGQRAQFTWALNQYNKSDDPDDRVRFAKMMAYRFRVAEKQGFSHEAISNGKSYPADEVKRYLVDPNLIAETDISEDEALESLSEAVDTRAVKQIGQGAGVVYAYGYACLSGRIKIGRSNGSAIDRIADQINASTPDKPVLLLEIRTDNLCGVGACCPPSP